MIAHGLLNNDFFISSLKPFFKNNNISFAISRNVDDFKSRILESRPHLLILQANLSSSIEVLNLVHDLRNLFGIIATIIVVGDQMSRQKLGDFLVNGADQFFAYPFDEALIEDFLSKRIGQSHCKGFKYRNVPSRGSEFNFEFDMNIIEVSSYGMVLSSDTLIKAGSILSVSIIDLFPDIVAPVEIIVISTKPNGIEGHLINCKFSGLERTIKSLIINRLRKI